MRELSKGRRALFLAALLLTTLAMMGEVTVTPAADTLYKEFGNEAAVNLFLSIPTLTAMFASLFFGALTARVNKKAILFFGALCFTVGGVCGGLVESLPYMTAMRCIIGLGLGSCNVAAISIVAQVFTREAERSRYTSFVTAGISLSGMLLTFLGGQLAEQFGWRSVFQIYWVGIPMLVMVLLFVPSCPPEKAGDTGGDGEPLTPRPENVRSWPLRLAALIASQLVWFILYGLVFFQISVYVAERNIGGEAFSGAMSSLGNLTAFAACLLFSPIYGRLKRATAILNYAGLALGFLLLLCFGSAPATVAACVLMGYSFGNAMSYFAVRATAVVPREQSSLAATGFSATMGIGLFLSTYVAMAVKALLNTDRFVGMLPAAAAAAVAAVVLSAVLTLRDRTRPSQYYL